MTHLAVDTTAREATALGYQVVVVADACATRALPDASRSSVVQGAVRPNTYFGVAVSALLFEPRYAQIMAEAVRSACR